MEEGKLTTEQRLLLLTARRTMSEEERAEIRKILTSKETNLFEVYKMAMYHKVATLCWYNMCEISPEIKIPKYLYSMLRYLFYDIVAQNQMYINECEAIKRKMKENYITVIPVKGSDLVPRIYQPYGIRYMGDLDFLVRREDGQRLETCLKEIGYIKGNFSNVTHKIEPISRAEDIKWKMSMSNFFPFRKMTGDDKNPIIKLDFRFSLDDSLDTRPVNEIIKSFEVEGVNRPAYELLHMCTHFYGEAKHTSTIYMSKDFNIIKLCDIRECALRFATEKDYDEMICFAKKYGLEKQVYFTFFYLKITYGDDFCDNILEKIELSGHEFMTTYGENTERQLFTTSKSYWNMLFDCGNKEMLETSPKFI